MVHYTLQVQLVGLCIKEDRLKDACKLVTDWGMQVYTGYIPGFCAFQHTSCIEYGRQPHAQLE